MAFVKLDTGILNSTLWVERECREVFITALLMAEPREFEAPLEQYEVRSLELTGWSVPPGWYGFVEAAGVGIIRRAMVEPEVGLVALEKLSSVDPESRSKDFDGRRMARVNGGYVVLNFMKYRDRDYTSAARSQRYRERQKALQEAASRRDVKASRRDITQAEAEADTEKTNTSGFALFWSEWPAGPRKTAKKQCEAKWLSQGCEPIHVKVRTSMGWLKQSDQWRKDGGAFIPAPLTWLNRRGWEFEIPKQPDPVAASAAWLEEDAKHRAEVAAERAEKHNQATVMHMVQGIGRK